MQRRILIMAGLGLLVAGLAVPWLWRMQVIELPAVAVRGLGRVAGVLSVRSGSTVQLPIAFHRQEHSLSCEVATLKMALAHYGVDVPESELIARLPFDRTLKRGGVWGDPNQGFVGSIDGKMLVDGYGVYWDPLARLGLRYKRTEVLRNATAAQVASHLAAGRPVIVWGYSGRYKAYTWLGSAGQSVQAVNGEHTRIVTGFSGPVHAPTDFSLIDPIYGPLSWSAEKFMENWTSLGRHGVVVYPHPQWVQTTGDSRIWEISKDGTKRHWIRSWLVFEQRGGYREAIAVIKPDELEQYKRGVDISS